MRSIISILVLCLIFVTAEGQNQNSEVKKIPHLHFPYEQEEKTSVQVKAAPVVMDMDNDGVKDEFDKEINSPALAAVDVFGVSIDSDKDGCLDFEDPEPLSSPVLPILFCMTVIHEYYFYKSIIQNNQKVIGIACYWDLVIYFKENSFAITPENIPVISQVVDILNYYPYLKVSLAVSADSISNKIYGKDLNKKREKSAINYFLEKGISENRIIIDHTVSNNEEGEWMNAPTCLMNKATFKLFK